MWSWTLRCLCGCLLILFAKNDPSFAQQLAAAGAVGEEIERLRSADPVERAKAAMELKQMGSRAEPAVAYLISTLDDKTTLCWEKSFAGGAFICFGSYTSPAQESAAALAAIGKPAVRSLIGAVKDTRYRFHALSALGQIKDREAVPTLIEALKDDDPNVREKVATVLGEMPDPRALDSLLRASLDENPDVAYSALDALGNIRDSRAEAKVISAAVDGTGSMRLRAIRIIGRKRISQGVEACIRALHDTSPAIQLEAAWSLRSLRDTRAVEPLIDALSEQGESIRNVYSGTLRDLTGKDLGSDPSAWKAWWDHNKASFVPRKD